MSPRVPRWLWLTLAYVSLAIGLIGLLVPGLPTTVFVLIAAWAAARGSERLHRWLLTHPRFGNAIGDWQRHGAVSRRGKWAATIAMAVCSVICFLTVPRLWMAVLGTAIMAAVALWLWRRPEPPPAGEPQREAGVQK